MPIGRRRPLMRGAMVAGAGYAAGKSRASSKARESEQEQRIAELESQQYAAPPPQQYAEPQYAEPQYAEPAGQTMDQKVEALTQLKTLLDSGVLTQQEFDAQKQSILAG